MTLVAVVMVGVISAIPIIPETMIGAPLPASATNLQVTLNRDPISVLLGEYKGYLKFELAPADVDTLLNIPGMQPAGTTTEPYGAMYNAVSGSKPMAEIAYEGRPSWWNPRAGQTFTVARRSTSQTIQTGADLAWYIIDITDPTRAIVYAFFFEV